MKKNSSTKDLNLSNAKRFFFDTKSPFTPKKYSNLKPFTFQVFTFNAGFKKDAEDLLIIIFDKVVNSLNFFSKTSTPSAPIIWSKKNNKGKVKALIVNSGNANAHTGKAGIKIINQYTDFLSKYIGCKKNEIIVSSTGVIGEIFDPKLIINQIKKINFSKDKDLLSAAKAIMTTDTYPKICIKTVHINNYKFKIYGIAKGSGMIKPNMATMLVYIFVEAKLPKMILKKIIKNNIENTFNSITVDSDTSTSDTLIVFSLNKYEINFKNKNNLEKLNSSICELMNDLSQKVIRDGEGISKLLKVEVFNAKSKKQAKKIGFSIAESPLVKTAITGQDANWGRVIMAIGKSQEKIIQNKIKIYFGKILVCEKGSINKKINITKLDNYMKNDIINIKIDLQIGNKNHTVYGNDLSVEYIKINTDYRS